RDGDAMQQPQGDETRLTVVLAGIFNRNKRSIENRFGVTQVDAMLGEIDLPLPLVPREHLGDVATFRCYVKTSPRGPSACKLTNQANRRDEGRAEGPPRSVRVEREVRRVKEPDRCSCRNYESTSTKNGFLVRLSRSNCERPVEFKSLP